MDTAATFNNVAMIVLVCIVGALLLFIGPGLIKEGFASTINPLKKLVGYDEKDKQETLKEQERVKKELLTEARTAYALFTSNLSKCTSTKDSFCECGIVDYLKLNNYQILVSNTAKKVSLVEESTQTPVPDTQTTFDSSFEISIKTQIEARDRQTPNTFPPTVMNLHRNGFTRYDGQQKTENAVILNRMVKLGINSEGINQIVLTDPKQSTIVTTKCP